MPEKFVVLAIDGGGIRGLIPAQVLARCEALLKKMCPDRCRISDHFDLVAGTSTGGILACGLLVPDDFDKADQDEGDASDDDDSIERSEYTANELVNLYMTYGPSIFESKMFDKLRSGGGWLDQKYLSPPIEAVLEEYFGNLRLSELVKPCLITGYDLSRRKAHFFRQHSAKKKDSNDFLVRDVCRATSAAPTFFEPAYIESIAEIGFPLVDGGVFANNPALCAIAEAMNRFHRKIKDIHVLSLGTGSFTQSYDHILANDWGTGQWILPLIDILMSSAAETADFQVRQLFESVERSENYLRIDTSFNADNRLHPSCDLDDAREENLQLLKKFGRELADENEEDLERFLQQIVGEERSQD
ncbi:patatin-like phospholipase family protein [Rosistilla oblonga]|uniref:patatin-like phospholipase family protein n=1 Tax=Rosistilla oblonga TaxID=2527990 RepID=UPI003A973503